MKADFDFIIIGSGVLGCLAYDYLSSRDNKVLLISEDNNDAKHNYVSQIGSQIYSGIISIELLAAQVLAIHALFNIGMIIIYRFFIHKEEDLITN